MRICETLGEDLWGFVRIHETGKGFVMIHRDLQDWERIHEDL